MGYDVGMVMTPDQEAALNACRRLKAEQDSYPLRRAEAIRAARATTPPVRWRDLAAVFEMTDKGAQKAAKVGEE